LIVMGFYVFLHILSKSNRVLKNKNHYEQ